jgi:hypothetical protein
VRPIGRSGSCVAVAVYPALPRRGAKGLGGGALLRQGPLRAPPSPPGRSRTRDRPRRGRRLGVPRARRSYSYTAGAAQPQQPLLAPDRRRLGSMDPGTSVSSHSSIVVSIPPCQGGDVHPWRATAAAAAAAAGPLTRAAQSARAQSDPRSTPPRPTARGATHTRRLCDSQGAALVHRQPAARPTQQVSTHDPCTQIMSC